MRFRDTTLWYIVRCDVHGITWEHEWPWSSVTAHGSLNLLTDYLVYPVHTIGLIVELGWGDRGLQERAVLGDKWYVTARAVNNGISNTILLKLP